MPVYRNTLDEASGLDSSHLTERLAEEMGKESSDQSGELVQPVILVEPDRGPVTRILVVWDDFGDMPIEDRSKIILDAWKTSMGMEAAVKVAVAMGLTGDEAQKAAGAGLAEYRFFLRML